MSETGEILVKIEALEDKMDTFIDSYSKAKERDESSFDDIYERLNLVEKLVWSAMGGIAVLASLIPVLLWGLSRL